MKILLIEDEIKIAEFTILGLTSAGFKVTHVTNGAAGLAAMLEGGYDLRALAASTAVHVQALMRGSASATEDEDYE